MALQAREVFRPVWVRALAVGLAAGWTLLEIRRGDWFWVALGVFATALAWWEFFGSGDYRDRE